MPVLQIYGELLENAEETADFALRLLALPHLPQFDFDLIGECGVMSLEKGMIFVLVTFVAALVWLLHFQYSQVFNQLKYSSAEEARFFN